MKYTSKLILNWEEHEFAAPSGGWRQPWANTLLYLPLQTDVIDQSGNNRSTFWYGTSSFTTVWNVPSANFSSGKISVSNDFITTALTEKTISCWVYPTFSSVNSDNTFLYWLVTDNCFFALTFVSSSKIDSWTWDHWNLTTADLGYSQNQWMLVTTTCKDWADNNKVYINWNLAVQWQWTNRPRWYSSATFNLWTFIGWTHNTYAWNINISNVILEDKARTAQEVSDYYNSTKSLYGIS